MLIFTIHYADQQDLPAKIGIKQVPTYADALQQIKTETDNNNKLVIKNSAYQVWPDIISDTMYKESINTFLIRDPTLVVKSLYRIVIQERQESLTKDKFIPSDIGFKELYNMYNYITNKLNLETIIIDSNDLLIDPKTILKQFCQFSGLQYNDCMLDWSNDDIIAKQQGGYPWDFAPSGWLKNVNNTTKFDSQFSA